MNLLQGGEDNKQHTSKESDSFEFLEAKPPIINFEEVEVIVQHYVSEEKTTFLLVLAIST